jgi:hypothetical protein
MRPLILLAGLLASASTIAQTPPMPTLLPLTASDIPKECGCSFGLRKGEPLIFWSWENDKQNALIREEGGGLRSLRLFSEKYFPVQHEPPIPGERMTLQLSYGNWSVQTANEVLQACAPKAKKCQGTEYRSRIILQWAGRQRHEELGWGHCGC